MSTSAGWRTSAGFLAFCFGVACKIVRMEARVAASEAFDASDLTELALGGTPEAAEYPNGIRK